MKHSSSFILPVILILFAGCEKEHTGNILNPKPLSLPYKAQEVISRSNSFGINIFKATATGEPGNMMLSPLSASTALTMLLNGCSSDTYSQIHQMLGYDGLTIGEVNATYKSLVAQLLEVDPEVNLALANSVWYRTDFQVYTSFLDTLTTVFNAAAGALDFSSPSALQTINRWAKDNTNGKIEKVLNEISPDAVMFLMNALYFKGSWTTRFDEDQTSPGIFCLDDGTTITVTMMKGNVATRVINDHDYSVLEMPYGRQNFSMVIIEPWTTLPEFLGNFNNQLWDDITARLDSIPDFSSFDVVMPRFRFDYEKVLNDQLKSLGMVDAFEPYLANLSGIADANIFVSFVKQNTFVEVNEGGTEAAAVTTIGIELTSANPSFIVYKPFIFAIRERTSNTLLFIGKVVLPEI
jgi:serpin B